MLPQKIFKQFRFFLTLQICYTRLVHETTRIFSNLEKPSKMQFYRYMLQSMYFIIEETEQDTFWGSLIT